MSEQKFTKILTRTLLASCILAASVSITACSGHGSTRSGGGSGGTVNPGGAGGTGDGGGGTGGGTDGGTGAGPVAARAVPVEVRAELPPPISLDFQSAGGSNVMPPDCISPARAVPFRSSVSVFPRRRVPATRPPPMRVLPAPRPSLFTAAWRG